MKPQSLFLIFYKDLRWCALLLLLFQPCYYYLLQKTHVIYISFITFTTVIYFFFFFFFFLGAERLWSPLSITQQGSSDNVLQRLQSFRCLLDGRGIAAAPLLNLSGAYAYGRVAPSEPGSCFRQWNNKNQNMGQFFIFFFHCHILLIFLYPFEWVSWQLKWRVVYFTQNEFWKLK
jgi:hypothetical protein